MLSKEDLKAAHPTLHNVNELLLGPVVIAGYAHVEGKIAGALAPSSAKPQFKCAHGSVSPGWTNHLDESGGAADQRRFAGGFVGVLGESAHERQINVHVRVDETREDHFTRGVDHFGVGWSCEIARNAADGLAFAENVRHVRFAGGNNSAIL